MARVAILTYFLVSRLEIEDARTMMHSARKQRNLLYVIMNQLKEYRVDDDYEKAFERDIKSFRTRCDHVYRICKENIRLTEHYPYFDAVGFDKILEFRTTAPSEDSVHVLDDILPEMEIWEKSHADEIEKHKAVIADEIRIHEAWKAKQAAEKRADMERRRAEKKAETEERRFVREMQKKNEQRRRRLEKDLNSTVKRAHGGWNA